MLIGEWSRIDRITDRHSCRRRLQKPGREGQTVELFARQSDGWMVDGFNGGWIQWWMDSMVDGFNGEWIQWWMDSMVDGYNGGWIQ